MEPSLTLLPTPDRTNIVEAGALLKTHDYSNQPVIGVLSPTAPFCPRGKITCFYGGKPWRLGDSNS